MYDKTVSCAYETDDEYRACLLAAFKLADYSDELPARIQQLYESPAAAPLLPKAEALASETGLSRDMAFFLLFSFDHFKQTRDLLSLHKANAGDQGEREAVQEPAVVGIEIPAQVP